MRQTFLTNNQLLFIRREKEILGQSFTQLSALKLSPDSLKPLHQAIDQLDELFLIVTVGEFNAGKSALINALLGDKVLEEGVTPTTAQVTLVRWGEAPAFQPVDEGFAIFSHPLPLLRELNIVDSPGTNAINRQHEKLTNEYVPRSDLVLFVTSADRPLTESERQFLERILSWGKKITLVINKVDILEDEKAVAQVRAFVEQNVRQILGTEPEVFTVSSKLAQKSRLATDAGEAQRLMAASGLESLEKFITETLDDRARLALKLENPIGVALSLQQLAVAQNQAQAADISEDVQLVSYLENSIAQYKKELEAEITPRLAEVENVLSQYELRGQEFFDNTMRLANITNLTKSEKIKTKFREEVLRDLPQEVESKVHSLINWLVDKDLNIWFQVAGALEMRQAQSQLQVEGGFISPQAARRKELVEDVGAAIRTIVNSYDREKEAEELGAYVTDSVAQTALFEAGAVGLGALVATALFSSAMDVTGIVAASTLAIVGLLVIPHKRRQAKDNFKAKMDQLRQGLMKTLTATFEHEFEGSLKRLSENITPYTQYVHNEQDRVRQEGQMLQEINSQLGSLKAEIKNIL